MNNVLVLGASGQLGSALTPLLKGEGNCVFAPKSSDVDICDLGALNRSIDSHKPSLIINCAAFHNVPVCESQSMDAFRVNFLAVRNLAELCEARGIKLITFSSDYVFGGEKATPYDEWDTPAPLQVYGMSRLAGEAAVLAWAPHFGIVVRTCGVFGHTVSKSKGLNFVDRRIQEGNQVTSLEMACEQVVSPTYAVDLATATLKLAFHPGAVSGIYHLINEGSCSWFDFTCAIYEFAEIPVSVVPVDRRGLSGDMRRPLNSALRNNKARSLGITMPDRRSALSRYISCSRELASGSIGSPR